MFAIKVMIYGARFMAPSLSVARSEERRAREERKTVTLGM